MRILLLIKTSIQKKYFKNKKIIKFKIMENSFGTNHYGQYIREAQQIYRAQTIRR